MAEIKTCIHMVLCGKEFKTTGLWNWGGDSALSSHSLGPCSQWAVTDGYFVNRTQLAIAKIVIGFGLLIRGYDNPITHWHGKGGRSRISTWPTLAFIGP